MNGVLFLFAGLELWFPLLKCGEFFWMICYLNWRYFPIWKFGWALLICDLFCYGTVLLNMTSFFSRNCFPDCSGEISIVNVSFLSVIGGWFCFFLDPEKLRTLFTLSFYETSPILQLLILCIEIYLRFCLSNMAFLLRDCFSDYSGAI